MSMKKGSVVPMSNIIGERIKYLRTLADMSQEELGNRVGVQRAAINKYENGSVTNIPITTVEKMAKIFDVCPGHILGWDNLDVNTLSAEVKIINGVKKFFGKDSVELLEVYTELTPRGKKKVLEYAMDMSLIHKENM